jgi:hypothetical protein
MCTLGVQGHGADVSLVVVSGVLMARVIAQQHVAYVSAVWLYRLHVVQANSAVDVEP